MADFAEDQAIALQQFGHAVALQLLHREARHRAWVRGEKVPQISLPYLPPIEVCEPLLELAQRHGVDLAWVWEAFEAQGTAGEA